MIYLLRNDVLTYCHIILKIYTTLRFLHHLFFSAYIRRSKKKKLPHTPHSENGVVVGDIFLEKLFKHRLPYIFEDVEASCIRELFVFLCIVPDYGVYCVLDSWRCYICIADYGLKTVSSAHTEKRKIKLLSGKIRKPTHPYIFTIINSNICLQHVAYTRHSTCMYTHIYIYLLLYQKRTNWIFSSGKKKGWNIFSS